MSDCTGPGLVCCDPIFEDCLTSNIQPIVDASLLDLCLCVGDEYSGTVAVTGGEAPYTFALLSGALPDGLTFNAETGVISGTTTTNGNFTFTIRVTDVNGIAKDIVYTFAVMEITTTTVPEFEVGVPYNFQLLASGGSGNYSWYIISGLLPDGVTLSESGLLSGTPGEGSESNTVEIGVVDLDCEAAQESFFPPEIEMTTSGTTTIRTYRGWPEYVPTEGKLYKKLTPVGTQVQNAWSPHRNGTLANICEAEPGFVWVGGARYYYEGYSEIDIHGNIISQHSLNLYVACNQQPFPFVRGPVFLPGPELTFLWGWYPNIQVMPGFCYPPATTECASCSEDEGTWVLNGDYGEPTPYNYPYNMLRATDPIVNTQTTSSYDGYEAHEVALNPNAGITNWDDPTIIGTITANWVACCSVGDWTFTLSEEYTDADADASQVQYTTNSKRSENFPDYQSWQNSNYVMNRSSRITVCQYTLNISNLVTGQTYIASVEYLDSDLTLTTDSYEFTAAGPTHVIFGLVPEPAEGHTILVQNPTIEATI